MTQEQIHDPLPSDPERAIGQLDQQFEDLRRSVEELAVSNQSSLAMIHDLNETLHRALAHLASLQDDHDHVKTGLWEKTGNHDDHLSNLQTDHDQVKMTVWSHEESVQRLKALWSDAQRDMTSLAEALARLDRD